MDVNRQDLQIVDCCRVVFGNVQWILPAQAELRRVLGRGFLSYFTYRSAYTTREAGSDASNGEAVLRQWSSSRDREVLAQ